MFASKNKDFIHTRNYVVFTLAITQITGVQTLHATIKNVETETYSCSLEEHYECKTNMLKKNKIIHCLRC